MQPGGWLPTPSATRARHACIAALRMVIPLRRAADGSRFVSTRRSSAPALSFSAGSLKQPKLTRAMMVMAASDRRVLLMPHPRIVRRVGVHGGAAVMDALRAQLVVPGLIALDLAQPVLGAVFGQPRRGIGVPDVDRVPRHVSRRVRGGHPPGGFLF